MTRSPSAATPTAPLRIAFIGCVEFSAAALAHLQGLPQAEIVGVATRSASKSNSDFRSLAPLANEIGCPLFLADGRDEAELAAFLRGVGPDIVYCFGWSYLLGRNVLATAPQGVLGFHPAALPRNRGRHPLIWAIALGLSETASSFFLMDEGADSGPILSQRPVPISADDTARDLYDRMTTVALGQIADVTAALAAGTATPVPQDHRRATSWRKRGKQDGAIDWRMPAQGIHNLIRALAPPYPGAHCVIDGREHIIRRSRLGDAAPADLEPGRVLAANAGTLTIRCGDGRALDLLDHDIDPLPAAGDAL